MRRIHTGFFIHINISTDYNIISSIRDFQFKNIRKYDMKNRNENEIEVETKASISTGEIKADKDLYKLRKTIIPTQKSLSLMNYTKI